MVIYSYHKKSVCFKINRLFVLIFYFLFSSSIYAQESWNQLGTNLNGNMGDGQGVSVALSSDGLTMATGAASGPDASNKGIVRVYTLDGSTWIQKGADINGEADGDSFGAAISLSSNGDVIAIGAFTKDLNASFAPNGRVQIYEWNGSTWVQKGGNLDGVDDFENFGAALSLSQDGNVVAIGAPGAPGGGDARGTTKVYKWNTTNWNQVGVGISGTVDFEGAGSAVSLTIAGLDTVLAVGSPQYYTGEDFFSAENEGRVRIYTRENNDWGIPTELVGDPFNSLGSSVSLSEDASRLAVGAPYDYVGFFAPGPFIGRVIVYENSIGWSQLGNTIVSSLETDEFGTEIALSGDGTHVIVGAPRGVMNDSPNGRVEIYEYTTDWTQVGTSISGVAENDQFGIATAISNDGTKTAIGAPSNDGGGADAGSVQVFEFSELDLNSPTVSITSTTATITNANPIPVTITFSEEVVGFSEANLTIGNGTAGTLTTSDNVIFIGSITPTTDGAVTVDIAAAVVQDLSGNDSEAAPQFTIEYDATSPVVTVDALITNVLSSELSGTIDDATATISVTVNNNTYTATNNADNSWTLTAGTVTPDLMDGDYQVSVTATDEAGNVSEEATATLTIDTNQDPFFTSTPVTEVDENATYSYEVTAEDPDGGEVTITATTKPDWLSLQKTTEASVSTVAGSGTQGDMDGQGVGASFNSPSAVAVDASGNLFFTDGDNFKIRKISPLGEVTTFAGSGSGSIDVIDGQGITASFYDPAGIALDASGNVYVTEFRGHKIRKISPSGEVTTIAGSGSAESVDGQGLNASFYAPLGIEADSFGNLFVADRDGNKIRKISPSGEVTTLAGSGMAESVDGQGLDASFNSPAYLTLDASGNVYVAEFQGHKIRKISPTGEVTTLAGSGMEESVDGQGLNASFKRPFGISVDASGYLYITEVGGHKIRKISPSGEVTTLAGSGIVGSLDGQGMNASFSSPAGIALDVLGNLYVAELGGHKIRKIVQQDLFQLIGDSKDQAVGDYPVTLTADDGNGGTVDQSFTVTINDVTAPATALLNGAVTGLDFFQNGVNVQPLIVKVVFYEGFGVFGGVYEEVSGLTKADIVVEADTTSTALAPSQTDNSFFLAINLNNPEVNQEITITVPAGAAMDLAGNPTGDYSVTFTYDVEGPIVSTFEATGTTNSASIPVAITFDQLTRDVAIEDFTIENGQIEDLTTTIDSLIYTFKAIPTAEGDVTIQLQEASVEDKLGNTNATASEVLRFSYDVTAPTVTISSTNDITNVSPVPFTFTFNEPIQALAPDSITVNGGTVADVIKVDDLTFTVNVVPDPVEQVLVTTGVSLSVDLEEGKVMDLSGNGNDASSKLAVIYDGFRPVISLSDQFLNPINVARETFSGVFLITEPTTKLELAEIIVTNATATNIRESSLGILPIYAVDFSATAGSDVVTISIAENTIIDVAGNGNEAVEYNVTIDRVAPTVEITSTVSNPTNNSSIPLTLTFSEKVIRAAEGALSIVGPFEQLGGWSTEDSLVYTTLIRATEDEGNLLLTLPEGAFQDLAGNGNQASETFSLKYDGIAPEPSFNAPEVVNSTATFTVDVGFLGETAIVGFEISKIQVANGSVDNIIDQNPLFFLRVTPSGEGDISLTFDDFSDAAGNQNTAPVTKIVKYDAVSPTVEISIVSNPVIGNPVTVTFTFSEPVSGFDIEDIGISANASIANFQTVSESLIYTVDVTPTVEGSVDVSIAAGVVFDIAENGNEAAELAITVRQPYSGGAGSEGDPYLISSKEDFHDLTKRPDDWSLSFLQTTDINLDGASIDQIATFTGTYDGGGFKIENFSKTNALFNTIESGAEVKNLRIEQSYGSVESEFSVLVKTLEGTLSNCSVNTNIESGGRSVTVLVFTVGTNGKVISCYTEGSISYATSQSTSVSGLAFTNHGLIEESYSLVNFKITAGIETSVKASGFILNNEVTGQIIRSYSSGQVNISTDILSGITATGLVDINRGLIRQSYSTSTVFSSGLAAGAVGLVAENREGGKIHESFFSGAVASFFPFTFTLDNAGEITNCYTLESVFSNLSIAPFTGINSGSITNSFIASSAGIDNRDNTGTIQNSFWQLNPESSKTGQGGEGKTQPELRTLKPYTDAGWDISQGANTIWRFFPLAYPVHNWTLSGTEPIRLAGTVVSDANGTAFTNGSIVINSLINGVPPATSTATINANGEFSIELPVGLHTVAVKSNDPAFKEFTFFGNTDNFFKSLAVSYDFPNMRIQMVPKGASLLTGNGSVSGRVVRAENGGGRIVSGRILDGEGIQDVSVSLIRTSDDQLMTTVSTDESGGFKIEGIPAGNYRLVLGVTGLDADLEGSTFDMDEEGTPLQISAAVGENGITFAVEEVLGVEDQIEVSVYPNPATDIVKIAVSGAANIQVIDLTGRTVITQKFTDRTTLDVTSLKANIYFLEITNDKGRSVRKLIKK